MAMLENLCEQFRKAILDHFGGLPSYGLAEISRFRSHCGLYIFRDHMGPLRVGQSKDVGARLCYQKDWLAKDALIERAYHQGMPFSRNNVDQETVAQRALAFLASKGLQQEIRFSILEESEVKKAGMTLDIAEGILQWAIRPLLNVLWEQTRLLRGGEIKPSWIESSCPCSCHYKSAEDCPQCIGLHLAMLRVAFKDAESTVDWLQNHTTDKR